MHDRQLGKRGPKVSALGLGCMGMSYGYGPADEQMALRVLQEAYDLGITFFDTADMYGDGENEKLVGKGIKSFRDKIVLATKCGLQHTDEKPPSNIKINNSPAYIREACHASLHRLGVDKIDLYYLHRYNPETPIEESMGAMGELIKEGKIDYVGVSEVSPEIIERAHAALGERLVAVQSEYSMANHETAELVLPTCRKLGLSFVAFSPLTRGLLSGKITSRQIILDGGEQDFRSVLPQFQEEALQHNLRLVGVVEELAKRKGCTVAQLTLAWLLAQGDGIIPIPGTKRLDYLRENIGAVEVALTAEDLEELQHMIQGYSIAGTRLPEAMSGFNWR